MRSKTCSWDCIVEGKARQAGSQRLDALAAAAGCDAAWQSSHGVYASELYQNTSKSSRGMFPRPPVTGLAIRAPTTRGRRFRYTRSRTDTIYSLYNWIYRYLLSTELSVSWHMHKSRGAPPSPDVAHSAVSSLHNHCQLLSVLHNL